MMKCVLVGTLTLYLTLLAHSADSGAAQQHHADSQAYQSAHHESDGKPHVSNSSPIFFHDSFGGRSGAGLSAITLKAYGVDPHYVPPELRTQIVERWEFRRKQEPRRGLILVIAIGPNYRPPVNMALPADPLTEGSSDEMFITAVYLSILGRPPEPSVLEQSRKFLKIVGTRRDFVESIWKSAEHRENEINQLHQAFFQTNADAAGQNYWQKQFHHGATEIEVAAKIAGSAPAAALYPAPAQYVTKLYNIAVGRAPSPQEIAFLAAKHMDRTALARAIFTSHEALEVLVQQTYCQMLGRQASAAEVAFRIGQIKGKPRGITLMMGDILTSQEFTLATACKWIGAAGY